MNNSQSFNASDVIMHGLEEVQNVPGICACLCVCVYIITINIPINYDNGHSMQVLFISVNASLSLPPLILVTARQQLIRPSFLSMTH